MTDDGIYKFVEYLDSLKESIELYKGVITAYEIMKDTTISEEQITTLLQAFKDSNPKAVEDYKKEPQRVIGFIVGYVMKNTAGKANGELVKSLIAKLFG